MKPIVNTIDGTPTFLSIGPQLDGSSGSCSNLQNVGGVVAGQYQYQPPHHHYHHNHQHYQHSHYQAGGAVGSSSSGNGGSAGAGIGIAGNPGVGGSSCGNSAVNQFGYPYHQRPQRLSRIELKQLDEKELIFELVRGGGGVPYMHYIFIIHVAFRGNV